MPRGCTGNEQAGPLTYVAVAALYRRHDCAVWMTDAVVMEKGWAASVAVGGEPTEVGVWKSAHAIRMSAWSGCNDESRGVSYMWC